MTTAEGKMRADVTNEILEPDSFAHFNGRQEKQREVRQVKAKLVQW